MSVARDADDKPVDLNATGRVILGMVAYGRRTGYEIKQFVDKTTRHFWAASYGQIYPELTRLEQQGLLSGRADPSGGRQRTVYELTDAGRAALGAWLESDEEPLFELRDEGMLKLFFSDVAPERRLANIRAMRERHERKLAQLRQLEGHIVTEGPDATLHLGIGLQEWMIEWCKGHE